MAKKAQEREAPNYAVLPPQNVEAEMDLLGSMIIDQKALLKAIDLLGGAEEGSQHFYKNAHMGIYRAICTVHSKGQMSDLPALIEYFGDAELAEVGGSAYFVTLMECALPGSVKQNAEIILENSKARGRLTAVQQITGAWSEAFSAGNSTKEFIATTDKIMRDALLDRVDKFKTMKEYCLDFHKEVEARVASGGLVGLPSHLTKLDEITGGWVGGLLYVLGGRPAMGKTSLGLQIGDHVVQGGGRACFGSLEMSGSELVARLVYQRTKIDSNIVRTDPRKLTEKQWEDMADAMGSLAGSGWVVIDRPGATAEELCAAIESQHLQEPLDIIIIDYLQLLGGMDVKFMVKEIDQACVKFKNLARQLNVPVILVSQLSRAVEARKKDKRPLMSDLRDSGGIEQNADVVLFTYREGYYNKKLHPDAKSIAEILIAKNRFGPPGTVYAMFDGRCTRFYEDYYSIAMIVKKDKYPAIKMEWLIGNKIVDKDGLIRAEFPKGEKTLDVLSKERESDGNFPHDADEEITLGDEELQEAAEDVAGKMSGDKDD